MAEIWVKIANSPSYALVLLLIFIILIVVTIGNAIVALKSNNEKKFRKELTWTGLGIFMLVVWFLRYV